MSCKTRKRKTKDYKEKMGREEEVRKRMRHRMRKIKPEEYIIVILSCEITSNNI